MQPLKRNHTLTRRGWAVSKVLIAWRQWEAARRLRATPEAQRNPIPCIFKNQTADNQLSLTSAFFKCRFGLNVRASSRRTFPTARGKNWLEENNARSTNVFRRAVEIVKKYLGGWWRKWKGTAARVWVGVAKSRSELSGAVGRGRSGEKRSSAAIARPAAAERGVFARAGRGRALLDGPRHVPARVSVCSRGYNARGYNGDSGRRRVASSGGRWSAGRRPRPRRLRSRRARVLRLQLQLQLLTLGR